MKKVSKYYKSLKTKFGVPELSKKVGITEKKLKRYSKTGVIDKKAYQKLYNAYRTDVYTIARESNYSIKEAREQRSKFISQDYINVYKKVYKTTDIGFYKRLKSKRKLYEKAYPKLDVTKWYHEISLALKERIRKLKEKKNV